MYVRCKDTGDGTDIQFELTYVIRLFMLSESLPVRVVVGLDKSK
jgi:hypothetical protein